MSIFEATFHRGGYLQFDKGWQHPVRVMDVNEIIYVVKGNVYIFEEDRRFELHKGDCIVLEKGKRHGGYEGSEKDVGIYWFEFFSDTKDLSSMKHVGFGLSESFLSLARLLTYSANVPSFPGEAKDCYIRLLLNEISAASARNKNNAYPVCGIIAEWIRLNSDRKIEVDELSKNFGYNKDYISRAFKRNFGVSLKSYIDAERSNYVKGLLLTTAYPLKQVSQMAGFPNYKSFLKFFGYHNNETPYEFRRKYFNSIK